MVACDICLLANMYSSVKEPDSFQKAVILRVDRTTHCKCVTEDFSLTVFTSAYIQTDACSLLGVMLDFCEPSRLILYVVNTAVGGVLCDKSDTKDLCV